MTTQPAAVDAPGPDATSHISPARSRELHWLSWGLANLVVITALSLASYYLLVDPQWGVLDIYPQPFTGLLFWGLMAVVWLGFNLEFTGFGGLRQPFRGIVLTFLTAAIGIAIAYAVGLGYGALDDSFSVHREGGAGFALSSLFVLFGFLTFVMAVLNWQHWPWAGRLKQPWLGFAEIAVMGVAALLLYVVFAVPALATWAEPGAALLDVNTVIGLFYCWVVSVVATGLTCENRPWAKAGGGARTAMAAVVGNAVVGTVIYLALVAISKILLGPSNVAALGPTITSFGAQFGVCWAVWMIAWGNVFGNRPTHFGPVANAALRLAITFGLGLITFVAYYYWGAEHVLHEPPAASGATIHGSALGWVDWFLIWMLWYVLAFESWGLPGLRADPAPQTAAS